MKALTEDQIIEKQGELIEILKRQIHVSGLLYPPSKVIKDLNRLEELETELLALQSSPSPVVVPDEEEIKKEGMLLEGLGDKYEVGIHYSNDWIQGANWLKSRLKQGYPEEFIRWLSVSISLKEVILGLPVIYYIGEVEYSLPELYQFWQDNIKDK